MQIIRQTHHFPDIRKLILWFTVDFILQMEQNILI